MLFGFFEQRTGKSYELAAVAVSQMDSDPALSLALAQEATNSGRTSDAVRTLRQTLQDSRLRAVLDHETPRTQISHVNYSPDGTRALTAAVDGEVRIWDVANLRLITSLKHQGLLNSVAFNQEGTRIVTAGGDELREDRSLEGAVRQYGSGLGRGIRSQHRYAEPAWKHLFRSLQSRWDDRWHSWE